jgi:hypothetical protein
MARQLTICEQPSLRWSKEAEIAVDGIHFRLMRSMLTLGVVVMAVAFLTNILVESQIADACKTGVREQASRQRELTLLAAFTDSAMKPGDLAGRIADLPHADWPLAALSGWLGIPAADLPRFQSDCRAWRDANTWLEELAPGHRRLLAGKRDREETFVLLETPDSARAFEETARRIPLSLPDGFMTFAARRRAFLTDLDSVANRFENARAGLATALGGRPLADGLSDASSSQAATQLLAEHGLRIAPGRTDALLRRAQEREKERQLLARLRTTGLPTSWRERYEKVFEQDKALGKLASDPACAVWLLEQAAPAGFTAPISSSEAIEAASRLLEARRLTDVEDRLRANYGENPGLSANMFWLLVVSFMVCMAGITNAMLLSVIERFREIATMKCLGALNGFIARLFLLEAAALGLVGGLLGVLLGVAIGVARMSFAYGDWVARFFPWSGMAATAGIATACGLILTTLSALYPAWSAARMHPIEAMRVE